MITAISGAISPRRRCSLERLLSLGPSTSPNMTLTKHDPLHVRTACKCKPSVLGGKIMVITQQYYLAHTARDKLSTAASRPDHDLRLLVGHANLLDSLLVGLAQAIQGQERGFDENVRRTPTYTEQTHIQLADTVIEDPEEDWRAEDIDSSDSSGFSDSDSEYSSDEEIKEAETTSVRRLLAHASIVFCEEVEEFDDDRVDYEDDDEPTRHLSQSRVTFTP